MKVDTVPMVDVFEQCDTCPRGWHMRFVVEKGPIDAVARSIWERMFPSSWHRELTGTRITRMGSPNGRFPEGHDGTYELCFSWADEDNRNGEAMLRVRVRPVEHDMPDFAPEQLEWLAGVLQPRCCHISGTHDFDHFTEQKYVCETQKADRWNMLRRKLGLHRTVDAAVSATSREEACYWCHWREAQSQAVKPR